MRIVLGSAFMGLAALFSLYTGIQIAARIGAYVQYYYGQEWGVATFGALFGGCIGLAWGMWRWQDRLTRFVEGLLGRTADDIAFCQRCGARARPSDPVCLVCGSTQLSLTPPGQRITSQWHVQIGMDVIGSDESTIGVVKQRRGSDFLVSRPRQRDVYVPYSAISTGDQHAIRLNVSTTEIEAQTWERPRFFGR